MQFIALALAPGIAISLFIFYKDVYNKEPKLNLLVSFLLGALAIVPAIILEKSFEWVNNFTVAGVALFAYLVVGFSEEFCKFLGLRYYAWTKKSFDEPLDGIVYSVMVSMGFATLENLLYVLNAVQAGKAWEVGIQRLFLSVPAHASFAVVMGYYTGKAKFDPARRHILLLKGIAAATFFHGTFDFLLFLPLYTNTGREIGEALLAAGAIGSYVVCLVLGRSLLREHKRTSQ